MNSIIKLDTRGRLVIPNEFRESLDLKKGDEVLLGLDTKTNTIVISPLYGDPRNLIRLEIEFGDAPGCLAKIAKKIAELKIDLIMTESKSFQRGKKARWDIIADISKCSFSLNQLKQQLMQSGFLESMSITKISRGRLHQ
jgi:AbrB family looped-hinge helix DNA binding protein